MKPITLALVLLLSLVASVSQAAERKISNKVMATFVYNFANFVEWPSDAFNNEGAPLKICLFGQVPFGPILENFDETPVRDRMLQILLTKKPKDIKDGCHILYVGEDQLKNLDSFFNNVSHLYVLSVGSMAGFVESGGILNILRTSDKARFEINLLKATENGLEFNSDLLMLARIINRSQSNSNTRP